MKIKNMLITFFVIALIALTGCQQGEGNTINVAGSSEITVEPDEAEVWAGISVVKDTAEEAQNEVNIAISAIVNGLVSKGISKEDIETENLNLYEERTWTQDEGSKLVGWRATQTLKIKTANLTKVGLIVDAAVSNGANQLNNINFQLSEEKEQQYKKQAIAEATKNAKEKAEAIAESLGTKLGKIKTVSESGYYAMPYAYAMAGMAVEEAAVKAATVLPGDVTVTANISMVYYIK